MVHSSRQMQFIWNCRYLTKQFPDVDRFLFIIFFHIRDKFSQRDPKKFRKKKMF
jgi:hypothetical protein